ncbi:CS1-pili formation C-terminal domain-containing protein [Undibacterium sp. CCC2.1]|nr:MULTISPECIES: CS1-pili formation C-terminal domain-containing protein [unclassified Undibacterium]MEB0140865.1 CS1-pili formation C-terminal domain-containing protein [Undibacterium sp. CCC2.1]MEB0173823.1 CS1-pili formation C-terminal domain-containing protein [Undibacterium sp. CCC1.1]MEB0177818.1 CS1-pili formation C-terminal domain-containing protein [Undibacterium sp. CCC3.4]MEB0216700.1 CS1-pili formation C-terminal domain-containing protein [Undibacterium sp. 5I2]
MPTNQSGRLGLLTQAENLPADFLGHFFDAPLIVRVEVDGNYAGDANVILRRDESVQMIAFTVIDDSQLSHQQRQDWLAVLAKPRQLGACVERCEQGLVALDYNLENSTLSLLTAQAEQQVETEKFHTLPSSGGNGIILKHSFNASGGGGQNASASYLIDAQGSFYNWTTILSLQADRRAAGQAYTTRQSIPRFYAQKEFPDHFVRVGYFTPDAAGVNRSPSMAGGAVYTTLGVMTGSSDTLAVDSDSTSTYPLYVTANRPGVAEVYRNGSLIYSQPVSAGLQVIDSRSLPGGIYEVEIRMLEDGQLVSRQNELVYKPAGWSDSEQRWRYSAFFGQQRSLLDSSSDAKTGRNTAGITVNYLLHPRAVLGLSAQQIGAQTLFGSSLDWDAADGIKMSGNVYQTSSYGTGFDVQTLFSARDTSLSLSHNRTWLESDYLTVNGAILGRPPAYRGNNQVTAASLFHRYDNNTSGSLRVSNNRGAINGRAYDLSLTRRSMLFEHEAYWSLAMFDRPAWGEGGLIRNLGLDVTLNLALGARGRNLAVSLGTRGNADGRRDHYAALAYDHQVGGRFLRNISGSIALEPSGVGLSANTSFENTYLNGNAYVQRSALNGAVDGGMNIKMTLALSANKIAASGTVNATADAGMIIDVDSDIVGLIMRAHDSNGYGTTLYPGRNFVPVSAYESGVLRFDFEDGDAPAAAINPPASSYHLNRGGVDYRQVRVQKTVTVMGRIVDRAGMPFKAAHVINHAGHTVTEVDGFFALEMSEAAPELRVRHGDAPECLINLSVKAYPREDGTLMAGDLVCEPLPAQALR